MTEGGRLPRFVCVYNYNMYSRGLSCIKIIIPYITTKPPPEDGRE